MNTIKSLIPNLFYLLGYTIALVSSGLAHLSIVLYNIGTFLHLKFKTKFGSLMKEYTSELKRLKQAINTIKPDGSQKSSRTNESNNRLLSIINGGNNNEPGSKV